MRRIDFLRLFALGIASMSRPAIAQSWVLSDAQWQQRLSRWQYLVLRKHRTEHQYTSALVDEFDPGTYHCVGCDLPLFKSEHKYDSKTGWPSFFKAIANNLIISEKTHAILPGREYRCRRCLGHHGHVFNDGPPPTELRYCNNGVSLRFEPSDSNKTNASH